MVSYSKKTGEPTEWYCLSTDTKPTENVGNGDVLVEIDTFKMYLFDADGEEWNEVI